MLPTGKKRVAESKRNSDGNEKRDKNTVFLIRVDAAAAASEEQKIQTAIDSNWLQQVSLMNAAVDTKETEELEGTESKGCSLENVKENSKEKVCIWVRLASVDPFRVVGLYSSPLLVTYTSFRSIIPVEENLIEKQAKESVSGDGGGKEGKEEETESKFTANKRLSTNVKRQPNATSGSSTTDQMRKADTKTRPANTLPLLQRLESKIPATMLKTSGPLSSTSKSEAKKSPSSSTSDRSGNGKRPGGGGESKRTLVSVVLGDVDTDVNADIDAELAYSDASFLD